MCPLFQIFILFKKKNDLAPIAFSFILHLLTDKYNNALVFNNAARAFPTTFHIISFSK